MNEPREMQQLAASIAPLLAGHDPAVQSGALADLLSIWLAAHFVVGDPEATDKLRAMLLAEHVALVRNLVSVNERNILANLRRGAH